MIRNTRKAIASAIESIQLWYWCAKEAANWLLFEVVDWKKKLIVLLKVNNYEMKYWSAIVALSDTRKKIEVLEYSLRMWIKSKFMSKNKERICAIWKNIILKKYRLSTQIEFIDKSLCQQQQMWTNY